MYKELYYWFTRARACLSTWAPRSVYTYLYADREDNVDRQVYVYRAVLLLVHEYRALLLSYYGAGLALCICIAVCMYIKLYHFFTNAQTSHPLHT